MTDTVIVCVCVFLFGGGGRGEGVFISQYSKVYTISGTLDEMSLEMDSTHCASPTRAGQMGACIFVGCLYLWCALIRMRNKKSRL